MKKHLITSRAQKQKNKASILMRRLVLLDGSQLLFHNSIPRSPNLCLTSSVPYLCTDLLFQRHLKAAAPVAAHLCVIKGISLSSFPEFTQSRLLKSLKSLPNAGALLAPPRLKQADASRGFAVKLANTCESQFLQRWS